MSKITRSKLKELIRQSIDEISEDAGDMDKDGIDEPDSEEYMDNKDKAIKKAMKSEGGKGSGRPAKPGGAKDTENKMMSAADAANAKMDADVKAAKKKKSKKEVKESVKPRRHTVREVQRWMKTLEENRYRKLVKADCRRVAWLVNNNLAEDYEHMPKSITKKWPKAAYGKERYLAKEFVKYKKNENKLRESIRFVLTRVIKKVNNGGVNVSQQEQKKVS